jgi:hypothetical protein
MHDDDELHVTYNAMQNGWQEHAPRKGSVLKAPTSGWTELHFEILRLRRPPRPRPTHLTALVG